MPETLKYVGDKGVCRGASVCMRARLGADVYLWQHLRSGVAPDVDGEREARRH